MLKKLLFLALASFSLGALNAQTTIPSGALSIPVLPDTNKSIIIANASSLAVPTRGANQNWNYSNVTGGTPSRFWFVQPDNNPNFPNATALDIYNPSLGALTLNNSRAYYQVNANGIFYLGFQAAAGSYSIAGATGNNADSLKALISVNALSTPSQTVKLPLNFGDSWSRSYVVNSDFLLTVTAFGLINVPVQVKQYITGTDSVVGWGNLTIGGNGYNQIPALLYDRKTTAVDSFFVNGQPAPATLLGALALTQGSITNSRINSFYVYDPMEVKLRNALGFTVDYQTNAIIEASYDENTFKGNVSVKNLALISGIKLFPNPAVNSSKVTLSFEQPFDKNLSLEIHSISGQLISTLNVPAQTSQMAVDLSTYAEGMYFIRLLNEKKQVVFYEKVIR